MSEKLIFVTNDDGYSAQGIKALIEVASEFGRVVCVAPKSPQSGMSQAITMHLPLAPEVISKNDKVEVCALNGTPVDCAKYALDHKLRDQKVDLVVSGINHGSNAAVNVLYSGTMGAAIEGSFYAPAVGFSLDDHSLNANFEAAKGVVRQVIKSVLEGDCKRGTCLNINIPNVSADQIKGIKVCRQNRGYWREEFFPRTDPRGAEYFWLTGAFVNEEEGADDTDIALMAQNYVVVVPIQVDMTDYSAMDALRNVLE